jgi:hypothetical protein
MRLAAIVVAVAMVWPTGVLAAKAGRPHPPALPPPPPPAPMILFAPKERDFTVSFPGPPRTGFHMLLDGKERLYMDNEGDRLFMVTASSFIFGAKADQDAYDRRLKRFADNADATLVSSQRLNWGGESGCEGVFTTPQGNLVLVRMAVHDKRLYQAVFWGRGGVGGDDTAEGRRFLESFHLTDR